MVRSLKNRSLKTGCLVIQANIHKDGGSSQKVRCSSHGTDDITNREECIRIIPTAQAKLRGICSYTEDEAEGTATSVIPEFLTADLSYADDHARRMSKTRRTTEFGAAGVDALCTFRKKQCKALDNCEAMLEIAAAPLCCIIPSWWPKLLVVAD